MDHIHYQKDAEEKLRKYATIEITLSNLNKRLKKLQMISAPRDITAVDFSRVGNGSSRRKDAIDELMEVRTLTQKINELQNEQETITDVLDQIKNTNKENYNFICFRYLENNSIEDTADLLGYSKSSNHTIYSIKEKALDNFLWLYYGE